MVSEKSKIYGVDNVGQSTPTLARTDGAIGLTVTAGGECQPHVNTYIVVFSL